VVENLLVKNYSRETLKHAHARFRGYITTKMFAERMLLKLIYIYIILENVGDDNIFFIELHDIQNVWMIDSMISALFKQVGLVVDVSNG